MLYRFEQLKTTNIPAEDIDCLRSLCRHYYKLSDQLTAYKNGLLGIVDQLFLSFTDVFKDVASATALAILEKYPTPEDILKADRDSLITLIKKISRQSLKWATGRYELLCEKARSFGPLSIHSIATPLCSKPTSP